MKLFSLLALIFAIVLGVEHRLGMDFARSFTVIVPGTVILAAGYLIGTLAMFQNPFFSGTVRIQRERNQNVVSRGVYSIVRHPGYACDMGTRFMLRKIQNFRCQTNRYACQSWSTSTLAHPLSGSEYLDRLTSSNQLKADFDRSIQRRKDHWLFFQLRGERRLWFCLAASAKYRKEYHLRG